MSDIQVGEYCRTAYGYIVKAKDYYKKLEIITINEWAGFISVSDITKHSFNIIDLIEEGDYVNGDKITHIDEKGYKYGEKCVTSEAYYSDSDTDFLNKDIKSIVTKESFKGSEYKV